MELANHDETIAAEQRIAVNQVTATVNLLDEGATVIGVKRS